MINEKRYITPDILDVDGFIHVIKGKVICFEDEKVNLQEKQIQKDLLWLANNLYVADDMKPRYGKESVCVLQVSGLDVSVVQHSLKHFPEDMQKVMREVCHTYE